ncbi:creatininase family protein [Paracoccus albus]|uniref:creatininase family protein n=1 Tax=Paracoccus albus TaxID=3017784 RepID=UPI0022F09E09|nr:creatininase family protein [Paracoccus albus]WBU58935.1 creatininase family protein [Paracoccus albus]
MKTEYGQLTWQEIRDADKDRVVILNVSATEDHGPHMPLDTDTVIGMAIARGVAERIPDQVLVMPPVPYGFNEHHKDFPGVIWIQPETLIAFITDITESLAHHGFRRVLLLNSHGSNHAVLDLAARKTVIRSNIICVSASWWNLIPDQIGKIRRSETGGIAHAGEMETAVYMHLHPELVDLSKAETRNTHDPDSRFFNLDLAAGGGGAMLMRWWSDISPDGTMGDPTVATPETGKQFLDAAITRCAELIGEMRALGPMKRRDHHGGAG